MNQIANYVVCTLVGFAAGSVWGWNWYKRRFGSPSEREAALVEAEARWKKRAAFWLGLAMEAIREIPVINECRCCGFQQLAGRLARRWTCAHCGRENFL